MSAGSIHRLTLAEMVHPDKLYHVQIILGRCGGFCEFVLQDTYHEYGSLYRHAHESLIGQGSQWLLIRQSELPPLFTICSRLTLAAMM